METTIRFGSVETETVTPEGSTTDITKIKDGEVRVSATRYCMTNQVTDQQLIITEFLKLMDHLKAEGCSEITLHTTKKTESKKFFIEASWTVKK